MVVGLDQVELCPWSHDKTEGLSDIRPYGTFRKPRPFSDEQRLESRFYPQSSVLFPFHPCKKQACLWLCHCKWKLHLHPAFMYEVESHYCQLFNICPNYFKTQIENKFKVYLLKTSLRPSFLRIREIQKSNILVSSYLLKHQSFAYCIIYSYCISHLTFFFEVTRSFPSVSLVCPQQQKNLSKRRRGSFFFSS